MAEPEGFRGGPQPGRPYSGRAQTWRPRVPPSATTAARPSWPEAITRRADRAAQRLSAWLAVEVGPGRLVPWLAIAFGCGIVGYFSIDQEPALWAAVILFASAIGMSVSLRHRPLGFPIALELAAVAAGFATATLKRAVIAHAVLSRPVWNVEIAGFVEMREARERSDRITVLIERMAGSRLEEKLDRIRVSLRKGTAPAVGSFVEFKRAFRLRWSRCDPAAITRSRYVFQATGASGFVLGRIRIAPSPRPPSLSLRYAMLMDGMRGIDQRIRAVCPEIAERLRQP